MLPVHVASMRALVRVALLLCLFCITLSIAAQDGGDDDGGSISTQSSGPSITLLDDDNDGVPNVNDACPTTPGAGADGCPASGGGANIAGGGGGSDGGSDSGSDDNRDRGGDNDADRDGVTDNVDRCPFVSGRGDQYGGVNGADGCPVDSDGDGTDDGLDVCPFSPQPPGPDGCDSNAPASAATTAAPVVTVTLATLPDIEGLCLAATQGPARVNVRARPDVNAPQIGALEPSQAYPVLERYEGADGEWLRTTEGWFAGYVTRRTANCDNVFNPGNAFAPGTIPAGLDLTPMLGVPCDVTPVAGLPLAVQIAALGSADPCAILSGFAPDLVPFGSGGVQTVAYSDEQDLNTRIWDCPLGNLAMGTMDVLAVENPPAFLEVSLQLRAMPDDFALCEYVMILAGFDLNPALLYYQPPLLDIYPAVCQIAPYDYFDAGHLYGSSTTLYETQRQRVAALVDPLELAGQWLDSNSRTKTCVLFNAAVQTGDLTAARRDFYVRVRECGVGPIVGISQVLNTMTRPYEINVLMNVPAPDLCARLADAPRNKAEQAYPLFYADFTRFGAGATPLETDIAFGDCETDVRNVFLAQNRTVDLLELSLLVLAASDPDIRCAMAENIARNGRFSWEYFYLLHDTFDQPYPRWPACLVIAPGGGFQVVLDNITIGEITRSDLKWKVLARADMCAPLDPADLPIDTSAVLINEPPPTEADISTADGLNAQQSQQLNAALAQLNATQPGLVPGTRAHSDALLQIVGVDSDIGRQITTMTAFLLPEGLPKSPPPTEAQPGPLDVSTYTDTTPTTLDMPVSLLTVDEQPPVMSSAAASLPPELSVSFAALAPLHQRDLLTAFLLARAATPDENLGSPALAQAISRNLPAGHPLAGQPSAIQIIVPSIGVRFSELSATDLALFLESFEAALAMADADWLLNPDFPTVVQAGLPASHPFAAQPGVIREMIERFAMLVPTADGGTAAADSLPPLTLGELAALFHAVDTANMVEGVLPGTPAYRAAVEAALPASHPLRTNAALATAMLG
jgi:hypothetical protein